MKDYLTVAIHGGAKWVTDGVAFQCCGSKIEMCPEIPCAGPLADLVRKHKTATAFRFDAKKRKWTVVRKS